MKENGDEVFGVFLRENAAAVLRRSILEPGELLAFRPWLFRLADLFNLCAVIAMALFYWGKLLLVPLPVALTLPALYALVIYAMRRRNICEQKVRREFLHVILICTVWVLGYVAFVKEPLGTLVALCNLTFVAFSIIGIAPWAGLLVMVVSLGGLYWLRLLQMALGVPADLADFPVNVVSAGGVGWLFLVLFFTTTFIANLVWRQKERHRAAMRSLEESNRLLRSAERSRNEFLSAVTHELRTPLVSIQGFTDLLLKKGDEQGSLLTIKRSANRLQRLIEELLDVAAPLSLASRLRIEPVNLYEILCEEAEALRAQANARDVRIEVQEAACMVSGDRTRVGQIAANLLDNALKHSHAGATIRVGMLREQEAGYGRFWVEDEGSGVSREMLPRIFEPFYSQPPHEGTPGLGIGLTISRQIATALKGEISVESEPGQGSRFTVRLPLERSEAANQPCLPSPVLRALVLDDEPDVLTLMQETLASFGFSVDAVRNGNMALEKATQNPYDLILLDVNVPGLTGIEVSRRIRAANRPGKILLFSALIRHDADAIIAEALADGFMPKPFNFETLERRMRQLGFAATL